MEADPFATFKHRQREMWSSFSPTAVFTTPVAAELVRFAGVKPGDAVLDVGTGTGVVAVTAAFAGAKVSALDLTPALLEEAHDNAAIAGVDVAWVEGDAENLPYADGTFDTVLSQFGHIFAPRPERAIAEMRRVLKPGGRIAFATWPPDQLIGKAFAFIARNSPPPPPGASPPVQWGERQRITERLASHFSPPEFETGVMTVPALSVRHYCAFMERSVGPMQKLVESAVDSPERLTALRTEFIAIASPYWHDNVVRQEYLITRAIAR